MGLDPHRNLIYLVSEPLAATCQGLLDLNLHCEPVPGIATEWEASADLLTYTFKLRTGALFHNGQEIDAAAVQWNFDRMRHPKTSHAFIRSALDNVRETAVVDKYTFRCHLYQPSAGFPANIVYYPCSLIAPESEAQAHTHPVGCGPFRFVRWQRYETTELARFAHYYETDAEGNSLPYLDGIVGRPKKEDQVRLTSLRAREVDLIDTMAYTDAAVFAQQYAGMFQTWEVPMLGTSFVLFNLDQGPFTDKRLRQAAARATNHDAIKAVVFHGRGATAKGYYAPASPWHMPGAIPYPAYDPDKAKFLLRQARAEGTEIDLQSSVSYPYLQQTGDLLQAMWSEVGFKVTHTVLGEPVLRKKRRDRDFHAMPAAASYRFDPDGWFSREFSSAATASRQGSGFHNEQADRLILEARGTADKAKRIERYTALESLLNDELPILYLHHLTLLKAGALNLHGYQPAISGAFSTRGAGIRTAWLAE
jgi:peptide/nickel transport system substrate-binding protein